MAQVTGYTAERMKEIEDGTVVNGEISALGHLILTRFDGTEIDAGVVSTSPRRVLSSARPTGDDLFDGLIIYETDTFRYWYWTGTQWHYITGGTNPYSFRVWRNAVHGALAAGFSRIFFDTTSYDYSNGYDETAGHYLAPVDGLWRWYSTIGVKLNNNPQAWAIAIFLNGVEYDRGTETTIRGGGTNDAYSLHGSGEILMDAGDTAAIEVYNLGGNLTSLSPGNALMHFEMSYVP